MWLGWEEGKWNIYPGNSTEFSQLAEQVVFETEISSQWKDLRMQKILKEIQWYHFTSYQKNFRDALTKGKLTGISILNAKETP